MATAPDAPRNASLVEHGSPDLSITPSSDNIPALTQDEVIRAGTVAGGDQPVKKKKAPPANGGIKKKTKKKSLPVPIPGSDNRISYDIHNLIIARDDFDFMKTGILPQTAPLSGNTKKVVAPLPDRMTLSGMHVSRTNVFCPECGMRVEKHGERRAADGSDDYVVLICPVDD